MTEQRVVIAEIIRERGNRGELLARSCSDVPGRLESLKEARVRLGDGRDESVEFEAAWAYKGGWVLKFAGVDSIASAQRYRGADLWVSRDERGHLPEGELFESDLIGCSVFDRATGRPFGTVTGLARYGGPALLEVQGERGEVLVPFVPAICVSVDTTDRSILVDLPEGLLEL